MSDPVAPFPALVGTTLAPVAHWLQLVKVADTESVRLVCEASGRGTSLRTAQRTMHDLANLGVAKLARRQHTTGVIVAAGAVLSARVLAHDLIVARVSAIGLGCGWAWERDSVAGNDHRADGILTGHGGRRVGVEVELTRKTHARTRAILTGHANAELRYTGVVYIGSADTMRYIDTIAATTGTSGSLLQTLAAVDTWTHTVDNDALRDGLTKLPELAKPSVTPIQQSLPINTSGATARPAAHGGGRAFSDDDLTNFAVPVDADDLTQADKQAAREILTRLIHQADLAGSTRTVEAAQTRLKELDLA